MATILTIRLAFLWRNGLARSALLEARVISIASSSAWFMDALRTVQTLQLASWCIGAGAVRNLVWDELVPDRKPPLSECGAVFFRKRRFLETVVFSDLGVGLWGGDAVCGEIFAVNRGSVCAKKSV